MCEMELMAKGKWKFRHTTDSNHDLPNAQNHLDRQFKVSSPNETWVTDITYIPTREGWLYLCVFVNLFSRIVVGYAMEEHMRTTLVTKALLHTLKVELVHDDDFHTRKEAKEKIIEYIELYYNSVRLHSTLGQMSPMEFERKESA
jgi:putative transposase